MGSFVRRRLGLAGLLMLLGVALLLAYLPLYGYNLCALSDDDQAGDNAGDFNSSFSNGFVAIPTDPYVFPSPGYAGPFVFHWHERPLTHWITPVPFSRSPPYAIP